MSSLAPTRIMATTLVYWVLVFTFSMLTYLIFIEEGLLIGAWMGFLFAVIIVPAGFLEVY